VTATALVATLAQRRIRLSLAGDGIQYEAPRGALTPDDREAIAAHRVELLALLRATPQPMTPTHDDGWADNVPGGPCGLGGSPLAWIEDWPMAREAPWLCPTCAAGPAPSLASVFQTLNAEERQRLDAEAADGDALARAVLRELAGPGIRRAPG
jgi:hypothetical protein